MSLIWIVRGNNRPYVDNWINRMKCMTWWTLWMFLFYKNILPRPFRHKMPNCYTSPKVTTAGPGRLRIVKIALYYYGCNPFFEERKGGWRNRLIKWLTWWTLWCLWGRNLRGPRVRNLPRTRTERFPTGWRTYARWRTSPCCSEDQWFKAKVEYPLISLLSLVPNWAYLTLISH